MGVGFSNVADLASKLLRFWGGDQSLGNVLTFQGAGKQPTAAVPGAASGKLLQEIMVITGNVVDGTGATPVPLDDTIPTNTEGFEVMTVSITPSDAANILIIDAIANGASTLNPHMTLALYQDAIVPALAVGGFRTDANSLVQPFVIHRMVAGTISPIIFRARMGTNGAGTLTFNGRTLTTRIYGGALSSYIRVRELTPP